MEMRGKPGYLGHLAQTLALLETEFVELPIIQPAGPFLDALGEDLRRRIFMTESESGASLCLRPDFTIPICIDHLRRGSSGHRRYSYLGAVFHQQTGADREILQIGIEDIGNLDAARADARIVSNACDVAKQLDLPHGFEIVVGDQGVFQAVVQALDLHIGWQRRLIRSFGNIEQIKLLLEKLERPVIRHGIRTPLAG